MRKEMTTMDAMKIANVSRGLNDSSLDKVEEIIERSIWDVDNDEGVQLNKMNAVVYGGRTLKSYDTIVAYYDGVNVIEFDRYSTSTSKQVTKFAEMKNCDIIRLNDFDKFLHLFDEACKFKRYKKERSEAQASQGEKYEKVYY